MTNPVIYRVYTEDKPRLVELVSAFLPAATVYHASGLYNRASENAAIVEVIAPDTRETDETIARLCAEIGRVGKQDSVLAVKLPALSVTEFKGEQPIMRDNFGAERLSDAEPENPPMCGTCEHTTPRRNLHTHDETTYTAFDASDELRARMIEMRAELGSVGRALFAVQSELAALRADVRRGTIYKAGVDA